MNVDFPTVYTTYIYALEKKNQFQLRLGSLNLSKNRMYVFNNQHTYYALRSPTDQYPSKSSAHNERALVGNTKEKRH